MKSAVPLRSKSIAVTSDGILQVIPDTATLFAAPLGLGPACQTTLPLNASTIMTPRPMVRVRVVGLLAVPTLDLAHHAVPFLERRPAPAQVTASAIRREGVQRQPQAILAAVE